MTRGHRPAARRHRPPTIFPAGAAGARAGLPRDTIGAGWLRYRQAEWRISSTNHVPSGVNEPELATVSIASRV